MIIFLAVCFIVIFIVICLRDRSINKQKEEIKKYKDISKYIIANKDDIELVRINKDLAWFELGFIDIEIYLGNRTFVKINDVDFGCNTELAKILEDIYYRDRESLLF